MDFKKIITVVAIVLTTIATVGCMGKETIAVEAPTAEDSVAEDLTESGGEEIEDTKETSTSTSTSTSISTLTTQTSTSTQTSTTTVETTQVVETQSLSTHIEDSTKNIPQTEISTLPCAGLGDLDESEPVIVDALIQDVSEYFTEETESETLSDEVIVYKPSTKYIHRLNCHWVDETCYEIIDTNGIEARICTECNPNMEIINLYQPAEVSSSICAKYLGNFRITGYCGDGQSASGKRPVVNHTIAMNNAQRKSMGLSYGDVIYIEGDTIKGYYTLEDCGCGWGVIDVFCSNEAECYRITSYADAYSGIEINN